MLWSLIKILLFVALIAFLAQGAGYLMETSGGIQITFAGTEYNLEPLHSVIALIALLVVVWVALKLLSLVIAVLRFLSGDETAVSRYFDKNRERRGYQALSDGLMALASGEGRLAMSKAARAEKYLGKPELTNLLTAQAAEMAGDTKKAAEAYKSLITSDATRFVGVRGIMKQKLADGEVETARKLAEKAHAMKPKHQEVQDVLLRLQAQAQDWSGARNTLSAKLKSGSLPRDVFRRRDAVLALSEAQEIMDGTTTVESREKAIEANRQSPDLVPAAALAARGYIDAGKPKLAVRILKKAWESQPHPDLAAAFAAIEPDETPGQRLKRFAALTRIHPDHTETRLVQTELQIVDGNFPTARRTLGDLGENPSDARAYMLMAAIERGEGASDAVVQGWLTKALAAPRGPQWVCNNCHTIQADWGPVCTQCNSFDTLSWKAPDVVELASATGIAMLPLIAGPVEDEGIATDLTVSVAPEDVIEEAEPESDEKS